MFNKDIIQAKKKLLKIEKLQKELENKAEYLRDKIHLYFDDKNIDTSQAESFIMRLFWENAYSNHYDGGYISNSRENVDLRFLYEKTFLEKLLKQFKSKRLKALDLGCGNGRYANFFADSFQNVLGIDLNKSIIDKNNQINLLKNLEFRSKDILDIDFCEKFDLIFVGGVFMYIHNDDDVKKTYDKLCSLLRDVNSMLVVRESVSLNGRFDYKSVNYIAYYRDIEFYKSLGECQIEENYGYCVGAGYLKKYFNVNKDAIENFRNDPLSIEAAAKRYISEHTCNIRNYFFTYRKV